MGTIFIFRKKITFMKYLKLKFLLITYWILQSEFLLGVLKLIMKYTKDTKNLSKISLCIICWKKLHSIKSVKGYTMKKYFSQLNNMLFQKSLTYSAIYKKSVKQSFTDALHVWYYQLPISVLTAPNMKIRNLHN